MTTILFYTLNCPIKAKLANLILSIYKDKYKNTAKYIINIYKIGGFLSAVKNRIFYYDFMRAVAIIAVIICHVDPFFGSLNTTSKVILHNIFHYSGMVGVPIFLMISGALILNRNYTLSSFMNKRFKRIVYPFIFWIILIMIVGFFFFKWDYA